MGNSIGTIYFNKGQKCSKTDLDSYMYAVNMNNVLQMTFSHGMASYIIMV